MRRTTMTIQVAAHTPNEVRYFPEADDIAAKLSEDNIQDIIEIFKTPLELSLIHISEPTRPY